LTASPPDLSCGFVQNIILSKLLDLRVWLWIFLPETPRFIQNDFEHKAEKDGYSFFKKKHTGKIFHANISVY